MANPVVVECPDKTVTAVAINVTSIDVIKLDGSKNYFHTYRLTGQAAPSAPTNEDNPRIPENSEWVRFDDKILNFRPSAGSDFYIFCQSPQSGSGYVRVDE